MNDAAPTSETVDTADIVHALAFLTPVELDGVEKIRVGNAQRDGGYILANRFSPGQKVYSYGIGTDAGFDLDLARRGLQIFMYDHTIDGLPAQHPNFHFRREGIAASDPPENALFSIAHHIRANGHDDRNMILKMDVEGAEWQVFEMIDPDDLARFEQITLEIHGMFSLHNPNYRRRFKRAMTNLVSQFHLFHVHSNNNDPLFLVMGLPVPSLLEVSFLRKDLGRAYPWRSFIPTPLDVPNVDRDDHVLCFYPFLPQGLPTAEFAAGLAAACRQAALPRPGQPVTHP